MKPVEPIDGDAVSVVIPTYNRERFIVHAVKSTLAATGPGDEIIVVDDGSTDGTLELLKPFQDRIRVIGGGHAGAGAARNVGIRAAKKPLITFLDSDDEWYSDKIQMQRELFSRRPDLLFCFSNFGARAEGSPDRLHTLITWHEDSRRWEEMLGPGMPFSEIGSLPAGRADFQVHIGSMFELLMERNYIAAFTLMVRREAAGSALHFGEDLPICEDWECFGKLARIGSAAYMNCDTAWQRGHRGERVSNADKLVWAQCRLKILNRIWGSDAAYLNTHKDEFMRVVRDQQLASVRHLLSEGRRREAHVELKQIRRKPFKYRVMAALPDSVIRGLIGTRRMLSGGFSPK